MSRKTNGKSYQMEWGLNRLPAFEPKFGSDQISVSCQAPYPCGLRSCHLPSPGPCLYSVIWYTVILCNDRCHCWAGKANVFLSVFTDPLCIWRICSLSLPSFFHPVALQMLPCGIGISSSFVHCLLKFNLQNANWLSCIVRKSPDAAIFEYFTDLGMRGMNT